MASEPCSKSQQLSTSIQVTESEARLFNTLLAAIASVNKQDTTLRVAGGGFVTSYSGMNLMT